MSSKNDPLESESRYYKHQRWGEWEGYRRIVPSAYRGLAFIIAATQIFLFPSTYLSVIPTIIIVTTVGVYSLVKVLYPLRWYGRDILSHALFGADAAICIFLLLATGGLDSPFLIYSLTPILTAALLANRILTLSITGFSVTGIIVTHLINPLLALPPPFDLSTFALYTIFACLTAVLPYLVNAHLRQHLYFNDALEERQRLSREIHDGLAQTLATLRWRAEIIRRLLAQRGIYLDEVTKLERLAEEAHREARESLELLRGYNARGSLLPHLQDYLEHLKADCGIEFRLDAEADGLKLEAPIELELARICQEAVTNIRKHSGAHNALVRFKPVNNHIELSIVDDGCGFDAISYYRGTAEAKGYGLTVMQERAQSIGANLVVLSRPGSGTEIKLSVPVKSNKRLYQ